MTRRLLLLVVAGLALALSLPVVGSAQTIKRETARPIDSVQGVDSYNAYCAVCHGKDGKGAGPAAAALKVPVPDLTTMAKRAGGQFSAAAVEQVISGKGVVAPAHGAPDMPIWGPIFRAISSDEDMQKLRVANLVKFIEQMQAK